MKQIDKDEILRNSISKKNIHKVQQYKIEVIKPALKELLENSLSEQKECVKVN